MFKWEASDDLQLLQKISYKQNALNTLVSYKKFVKFWLLPVLVVTL